jgi:hypothetical protein
MPSKYLLIEAKCLSLRAFAALVKMLSEDALIFGLWPDKQGNSSIECEGFSISLAIILTATVPARVAGAK